jgi:hypothetical protein
MCIKLVCVVLALLCLRCTRDSGIETASRYAIRSKLSCCSALANVLLQKTELQEREWNMLVQRDQAEATRCLALAMMLQGILFSLDAVQAADVMHPPLPNMPAFSESDLETAAHFHLMCSKPELPGTLLITPPDKL